MMSAGGVQPLGPGQSDQLMIEDSDSDEDYWTTASIMFYSQTLTKNKLWKLLFWFLK